MDQKGREIVPYDTVLGKHEQFQMKGKINASLLAIETNDTFAYRSVILCLKALCN